MKLTEKDKDRLTCWIAIIILLFFIWLLSGCRARTLYVPVETVRTEYKDRFLRDSIVSYDSIYVKEKGDTLIFEKYKYLYRDRLKTDTVVKIDSIQVPYPVVEFQEVNRLSSFQGFQVWCGRILLLLVVGWGLVKWVSKSVF